MSGMELTERQKKILALVVEHYTADGEPVGSKLISSEIDVSSATVRNEMALLSAAGLIVQPHTSAGRVPGAGGYRYYIDHMIPRYDFTRAERHAAELEFRDVSGEPAELLARACERLSDIAGCAAVATTPYDSQAVVKRVELVSVSRHAVLVIVMLSTGVICHKVCSVSEETDIVSAELFYRVMNAFFINKRIGELSAADIQTIAASLGERLLGLLPLLLSVTELVSNGYRSRLIIRGQNRLIERAGIEPGASGALAFIKNTSNVVSAMRPSHDRVSVRIGTENHHPSLENSAVILSTYSVGGRDVGSIGVIGPQRMDYARVIPSVVLFAQAAGKLMSDAVDE